MRPLVNVGNAVSMRIRPPRRRRACSIQGIRQELRDSVSEYLSQAPTVAGPIPKALIVPHAGYIYSGVIAGAAYAQVAHRRSQIRRIVLIGPESSRPSARYGRARGRGAFSRH